MFSYLNPIYKKQTLFPSRSSLPIRGPLPHYSNLPIGDRKKVEFIEQVVGDEDEDEDEKEDKKVEKDLPLEGTTFTAADLGWLGGDVDVEGFGKNAPLFNDEVRPEGKDDDLLKVPEVPKAPAKLEDQQVEKLLSEIEGLVTPQKPGAQRQLSASLASSQDLDASFHSAQLGSSSLMGSSLLGESMFKSVTPLPALESAAGPPPTPPTQPPSPALAPSQPATPVSPAISLRSKEPLSPQLAQNIHDQLVPLIKHRMDEKKLTDFKGKTKNLVFIHRNQEGEYEVYWITNKEKAQKEGINASKIGDLSQPVPAYGRVNREGQIEEVSGVLIHDWNEKIKRFVGMKDSQGIPKNPPLQIKLPK